MKLKTNKNKCRKIEFKNEKRKTENGKRKIKRKVRKWQTKPSAFALQCNMPHIRAQNCKHTHTHIHT